MLNKGKRLKVKGSGSKDKRNWIDNMVSQLLKGCPEFKYVYSISAFERSNFVKILI